MKKIWEKIKDFFTRIPKSKPMSLIVLIILTLVSGTLLYYINSPFFYTLGTIFILIACYIISISFVTYSSTRLNFFKIGFNMEEFNNIKDKTEKDAYLKIEMAKLIGKNIIYAFLILGVAIIIGYGYSLIQFRL